MSAYLCEWERENSPTRGLTESDAKAYWKAHAVAGDARFALRQDSTYPEDLRAVWRSILAAVTVRKATPADRIIVDRLRQAWRNAINGWAYTVPAGPAMPTAKPRKPSAMPGHCPTCGQLRREVA